MRNAASGGETADQSRIFLSQWQLTQTDRQAIANAISLDFRSDGQMEGAVECNTFQTNYKVDGLEIEVGNANITAAGCHPRFDANPRLVEQAAAVLFSEPPAKMNADGDVSVLTGASVLVFERVR